MNQELKEHAIGVSLITTHVTFWVTLGSVLFGQAPAHALLWLPIGVGIFSVLFTFAIPYIGVFALLPLLLLEKVKE